MCREAQKVVDCGRGGGQKSGVWKNVSLGLNKVLGWGGGGGG